MSQHVALKAVGFWRDTHGVFRHCPRPQWLVERGWHAAELDRIIEYLRAGHDFVACCGWSVCRFRGCREGERNGSGNFTDGEWYWPEGLAHYVERHAVLLPEAFVETMRANGWRVPQAAEHVAQVRQSFDYGFWLEWTRRERRRHWHRF